MNDEAMNDDEQTMNQRITKPYIKKNGRLEETSFEEAFLYICQKLHKTAFLCNFRVENHEKCTSQLKRGKMHVAKNGRLLIKRQPFAID